MFNKLFNTHNNTELHRLQNYCCVVQTAVGITLLCTQFHLSTYYYLKYKPLFFLQSYGCTQCFFFIYTLNSFM